MSQPALLQVVCARLWRLLPQGADPITIQEARDYGNVDVALAAHCGQVIAAVASEHNLSARRLCSWLLSTFVTEYGELGTAYEGPGTTASMPNAVVRALQDRHLLASSYRSGMRWYELLSERLIEPLRAATDERPSPAEPMESLRAAERALTLGELDVAERYAKETLQATRHTDLRLHAEADSLLGNLAHEREKPREAEDLYRGAARLFEALRDTARWPGSWPPSGRRWRRRAATQRRSASFSPPPIARPITWSCRPSLAWPYGSSARAAPGWRC